MSSATNSSGVLWQNPESITERTAVIGRFLEICLDILIITTRLMKSHKELSAETTRLKRATQALVLWDSKHKVVQGHLDTILAKSGRLQGTVNYSMELIGLELVRGILPKLPHNMKIPVISETKRSELLSLITLCRNVRHESRGTTLGAPDEDGNASSSSDDEDGDGLETKLDNLDCYIECLIELDSALSNPAIDLNKQNNPDPRTNYALAQYHQYSMRIKDLYPRVSEEIAGLLGEVNYRQYWQLHEMRERAEQERSTNPQQPRILNIDAAGTVFHDSGIGTSVRTETVYAKSHASSNVSEIGHGKGSYFPALTREAKLGSPFRCGACGHHVAVTRPSLWKQHLINDLKPYHCIFERCSHGHHPFPTRDAWMYHMEHNHDSSQLLTTFTCPFCNEVKGNETRGILTHISKHLEVISAIVLPRNQSDSAETLSSESSDDGDEKSLLYGEPGHNSQRRRSIISRDEGISKQSAARRTTKSSNNDDDHTIKLPKNPIVEVGNSKLNCAPGEYDTAKVLLIEGSEDLNLADRVGNTPLLLDALKEHEDNIKLLSTIGCSREDRIVMEATPIFQAAVNGGHSEFVKRLSEIGTNSQGASAEGKKPLELVPDDSDNAQSIRADWEGMVHAHDELFRTFKDRLPQDSHDTASLQHTPTTSRPPDPPPTDVPSIGASGIGSHFRHTTPDTASLECSHCDYRPLGNEERVAAYLRKHMKTHTRDIIQCPVCDKRFSRRHNKRRHIRQVHPEFLLLKKPTTNDSSNSDTLEKRKMGFGTCTSCRDSRIPCTRPNVGAKCHNCLVENLRCSPGEDPAGELMTSANTDIEEPPRPDAANANEVEGVLYDELQAEDGSSLVRFVTLEDIDVQTNEVICRLETVPFNENLQYRALSYCWGDPKNLSTIICNGIRLEVTSNLATALHCLLRQGKTRSLPMNFWIDAICINQQNDGEKESQVMLMGEIFRQALEVIVWLGPAADNSDLALELCQRLCSKEVKMQARRTADQENGIEKKSKSNRWAPQAEALIHVFFDGKGRFQWRGAHRFVRELDAIQAILRRPWCHVSPALELLHIDPIGQQSWPGIEAALMTAPHLRQLLFRASDRSVELHPSLEDNGGLTLHGLALDSIKAMGEMQTGAEARGNPRGMELFDYIRQVRTRTHSIKKYFKSALSAWMGVPQVLSQNGTEILCLASWGELAYSNARYPTGESLAQAFVNTLHRGWLGDDPERTVSQYSAEWRRIMSKVISVDQSFLLRRLSRQSRLRNSIASMVYNSLIFFKDAKVPLDGHAMYTCFSLTKQGYFALVPHETQEGDKVVLFKGGPVPFIIRPKAQYDNTLEWELVGPCYVHGIMHGEQWNEELCEPIKLV
ncbi:putative Heterokaryon incompatibility protein-domain-containing protein [Seiridium unicorne]|uniref:Heterokaryon incompatibility protein-domain-containing protein n=1 Tax=Seiridium unicorne TaxID=138068 RepID=A0ABR2UQ86_9PEZI